MLASKAVMRDLKGGYLSLAASYENLARDAQALSLLKTPAPTVGTSNGPPPEREVTS